MQENVVVETVSNLPFGIVIAWIIGIVAILSAMIVFGIKVFKWMEKYRTVRNEADNKNEEFNNLKSTVEKIENHMDELIIAQKESMADRLNQKIKHYYRQGYIPLDEFDEFEKMYEAYRGIGGNGSIEAKYNKCREELPMKDD